MPSKSRSSTPTRKKPRLSDEKDDEQMEDVPTDVNGHNQFANLIRPENSRADAMQPTTLVTGYRGSRGERIRHVVHKGALSMPEPLVSYYFDEDASAEKTAEPDLPGLDSVSRPLLSSKPVTVTHVKVVMQPNGNQAVPGEVSWISTTVAQNKVHQPINAPEARIRGGGDEASPKTEESRDGTQHVDTMKEQNAASAAASAPGETTSSEGGAQAKEDIPTPEDATSTEAAPADKSDGKPQALPTDDTLASPKDVDKEESSASDPTTAAATKPDTNTPTDSSLVVSQPPAAPVRVEALPSRPAAQWEQHKTTTPATTSANDTTLPSWYKPDGISSLEQQLLPEWFNKTAAHRTPAAYLEARQAICTMAQSMTPRYITGTMVRRSIPGDSASLLRLHSFLQAHFIINKSGGAAEQDGIMAETTPTPSAMFLSSTTSLTHWNEVQTTQLLQAVVEEQQKRGDIDWSRIASQVGGRTAEQCEQQFLIMNIVDEEEGGSTVTPDQPHDLPWLAQSIEALDPDLLRTVSQAALKYISSVSDAQKATRAVSVAASRASERTTENILNQTVELRMQRLEDRMSMLDEVEGLLEAERVALELERRDLYTARCRHWFQGS